MQTTPFETHDLMLLNRFYPRQRCEQTLQDLIEQVSWSRDHYQAFGRRIDIPRLQAWYADTGIRYSYSNNLLQTLEWIEPLVRIRQEVEAATRQAYNSVLLTYYRDGDDSLSWHADDERELGRQPYIASLSLGASRRLHYRHKQEEIAGSIELHSGDLLFMRPGFQFHWEHSVPAQPEIRTPRINLTFRSVVKLNAGDDPGPQEAGRGS